MFQWWKIDKHSTIVQAFGSSRLDNCNSVVSGIDDSLTARSCSSILVVHDAAARLAAETQRCDLPVLGQIHWFPVHQRSTLNVALKALHGLVVRYTCMADDCQLFTDVSRSQLCSLGVTSCIVQRPGTSWRSCVDSLRTTSVEQSAECWSTSAHRTCIFSSFRRAMKTCICVSELAVPSDLCFRHRFRNLFTYLLARRTLMIPLYFCAAKHICAHVRNPHTSTLIRFNNCRRWK